MTREVLGVRIRWRHVSPIQAAPAACSNQERRARMYIRNLLKELLDVQIP
jgi:hypothetical protein